MIQGIIALLTSPFIDFVLILIGVIIAVVWFGESPRGKEFYSLIDPFDRENHDRN